MPQATVLYDGLCRFCQHCVRVLSKLDWLKKLKFQDCRRTDELPVTNPPLDPQRLIEEMHLVPASGSPIYHGYTAFRYMAWRLPLLWIIAPLLYIPGVPWIGQKIYLWIAKHRFGLVPCSENATECRLPGIK